LYFLPPRRSRTAGQGLEYSGICLLLRTTALLVLFAAPAPRKFRGAKAGRGSEYSGIYFSLSSAAFLVFLATPARAGVVAAYLFSGFILGLLGRSYGGGGRGRIAGFGRSAVFLSSLG